MVRFAAFVAVSLLALSPVQGGTVRVVNRSQGTWMLTPNPLGGGGSVAMVIQPGESQDLTLAAGDSARFLLGDGVGRSYLDLAFACAADSPTQAVRGEVICTEPHAQAWAPAVVDMGLEGEDLEVALTLDGWPAATESPVQAAPPALVPPASPFLSPTTSAAVDGLLAFLPAPQMPDAPVNVHPTPESSGPALPEATLPAVPEFSLEPAAGATHVFALPGRSLLNVTEATLAPVREED